MSDKAHFGSDLWRHKLVDVDRLGWVRWLSDDVHVLNHLVGKLLQKFLRQRSRVDAHVTEWHKLNNITGTSLTLPIR